MRPGPVRGALLSWTLASAVLCAATASAESWPAYLDYAYVYSSAEPDALRARLAQYGSEAGIKLEDYAAKEFGPGALQDDEDETRIRRAAIAQLLIYLANGDPEALDESVDTIRRLEDRLSRHENRYWYHYILAHYALENGQRFDFVGELLDLWLHVIVPLETPYQTLQTLSLGDSQNSGFVSSLPYLFENIARIILIRSQKMGLDRDLDPLGAVVRMLYDGRVGAHPDVIPVELSSRDYLERIVTRLDGPESDVGSLTFVLALFEASKYHDRARALLASEGLSDETVKALRVSAGAYETALNRAETLQGEATVYGRVLRQLGEVYAAKQRLGVDPDIQTSFSIEGAIDVYTRLARAGSEADDGIEGWEELGFERREAWVATLHHLWEEIQEVSLNAADYYLTRAVEQRHLADDHARSAGRIHARYLSFFHKFVSSSRYRALVPDSAYFAAYEAARGYGDAMLAYTTGNLSHAEMDLATQRYVSALKIFPFDRKLWQGLTAALERQGRESEYLALARPVAETVTGSRHVDAWIENGEPGAEEVATLRRAMADSQVLVYLGFAEESGVAELAASLDDLKARRDQVEARLEALTARRESIGRTDGEPPASLDEDAPANAATGDIARLELADLSREIADSKRLLGTLESQIEARTRALPLYQSTLGTGGIADELRARRDHPMHTLLRRMYHEKRGSEAR